MRLGSQASKLTKFKYAYFSQFLLASFQNVRLLLLKLLLTTRQQFCLSASLLVKQANVKRTL